MAGAPDVGEVVGKLQAACAKTQDLSARFQQTVSYRSLNLVRDEGGGSFLVKRPGKVRWEYDKPEPRLFVTDGKTLWVYSPAEKQVRILEAGEAFSSRVPLSFLAGDCDLRREFTVAAVEHAATRGSANLMVLDLKPLRPEAGITRILLEVNLQSYLVEKTTAFDAAGNTTVIALSDVKLNTGLSDRQFQFTPPADVTVVNPAKR
jgi:outer membrane lipoprotein carrier protein